MLFTSTFMLTLEEFKEQAVASILAETSANPDELHKQNILSKHLSEINVDSLTFVEIVIVLEDLIEHEISDKQLSGDPVLNDFLLRIYHNKL